MDGSKLESAESDATVALLCEERSADIDDIAFDGGRVPARDRDELLARAILQLIIQAIAEALGTTVSAAVRALRRLS